jgi:hypothetical protein
MDWLAGGRQALTALALPAAEIKFLAYAQSSQFVAMILAKGEPLLCWPR